MEDLLRMEGKSLLKFNAKWIAIAHAACAYSAFLSALIVGCWLHYHKIVQNSSWGYPDEWFPSVSATIGDRYPERSIFQIMIALTSGPRFLLLLFNFIRLYKEKSVLPYLAIFSGVVRTFTCGGWVYITSTDDMDWHNIFMISYIFLTIPWTICISKLSPPESLARRSRILTAWLFFLTLAPLIYWFIQHKVHDRAGAYSVYAYFEWSLILLDVAFDTCSIIDFADIEISVTGEGFGLSKVVKEPKKASTKSKKQQNITEDFTMVEFIANIINSAMFWTIITALLVCVWYFPLWHMGLSGYEVVVISFFVAPIFIAIPFIRNLFMRFPFFSRFLSVLLGIGSYKIEEPETRLLLITLGTTFSIISFCVEFYSFYGNSVKFNSYGITFMLGLLATSIMKFSSYSNNPVWPIMHKENGGYNEVGILVGLLGAFFTPSLAPQITPSKPQRVGGFFLLSAIGFGGYFFSLHSFLSDSATLALWTWEGYPIRGPTPITGALYHIGAVILGIFASLKFNPDIFSSKYYNFIVGGISAYVLYAFKNWEGYIGALIYLFYLTTLCPIIFQSLVGYNPSGVFFVGFLFSVIISLASIWIVAYAFVPLGYLLRERTDIVLGVSYFMILCGVFNYNLRKNASNIVKINLSTVKLLRNSLTIISVFVAIAISIFFRRYTNEVFVPYNADSRTFTTGIWCVHFGLDNDMWSSDTRMKNLIADAEIDIIGLLETDTQRLIGGNRDFTQKIAEELGMYVDYGPGPNKHTWGAALLSKFPILNSTHHLLPSPVGELAPAIHATLDIYGELVDVVVFHSGQEEDVEDRRLQSLELQRIMGGSNRPLVLLSYLVTTPLEGNYNTYVSEKSRMYDIDSTDWDRWCEYILFRDLKKVAYARISRSTITDTELQIAKFRLLSEEERNENDLDFLYGNHFIDEDQVDENLRLPQKFRGDGIRGHRYHVFDEPRYFAL